MEDKEKEIQSSKSFATKLFKFKEIKKKSSEVQPKKKKIKEKNTNNKKQSKFKKLNVCFHFYNLIFVINIVNFFFNRLIKTAMCQLRKK